MSHRLHALFALLVAGSLLAALLVSTPLQSPTALAAPPAQAAPAAAPVASPVAVTNPIEMSYVPAEAFLGVLVQPAQVLSSPEFEPAPIEVLQAVGMEQFGIDPLDVSQVLWMMAMVEVDFGGEMGEIPSPVGVVRFSKAYSLENMLTSMKDYLEEGELNGKPMLRDEGYVPLCFYMPDDTTLLMAPEDLLQTMLSQDAAPETSLVEHLNELAGEHDAVGVFDIAPLRPVIEQESENAPPLPQPLASLLELPELLEVATLTANVTGDRPTTLSLVGTDDDAAAEMEEIITGSLGFGQAFLLAAMEETAGDTEDSVELASLAYMSRVSEYALATLTPQREGDRLTLTYQPAPGEQAELVSLFSSGLVLGLPAVGSARKAAERNMALNNMRQLALSATLHEASTTRYPRAGGNDEEGHERPGLSWRVYALPHVESMTLFDQFHRDEPWDSEHNLALVEQMPDVFKSPGIETEPGYTHYQFVTGEGTAFTGGKGPRIQEFLDGISPTVIIVEADEPVIWTKPDDWEFDPENPTQGLGNLRPGNQFLAGFADGHVSYIDALADSDLLKAIFTHQGGEAVSLFELEAGR